MGSHSKTLEDGRVVFVSDKYPGTDDNKVVISLNDPRARAAWAALAEAYADGDEHDREFSDDLYTALFHAGEPRQIERPKQVSKQAMLAADARAWQQFRDNGLLWWVNRILHVFRYSISAQLDDDGTILSIAPKRTTWLGFTRAIDEDGLAKFKAFIAREGLEEWGK